MILGQAEVNRGGFFYGGEGIGQSRKRDKSALLPPQSTSRFNGA
jgi:hypothetical protein